MTLVGNKSDLHMQRAITKEEVSELAKSWDCAWTEASARHNENVTRCFELCIEQIEKENQPASGDKKGCTLQ